ncbi:hypothetical protein BPTFM16_02688 [Altererythrobacter insulae]|nr:hypothetical protein BPTFM16_02688 [Altererythrobacter insulae]
MRHNLLLCYLRWSPKRYCLALSILLHHLHRHCSSRRRSPFRLPWSCHRMLVHSGPAQPPRWHALRQKHLLRLMRYPSMPQHSRSPPQNLSLRQQSCQQLPIRHPGLPSKSRALCSIARPQSRSCPRQWRSPGRLHQGHHHRLRARQTRSPRRRCPQHLRFPRKLARSSCRCRTRHWCRQPLRRYRYRQYTHLRARAMELELIKRLRQ